MTPEFIASLDGVESARVHLVIPERQLFERDKLEPTASIVLKTRGRFEAGQVRAIQNLVAGAVPNMRPDRVTVVDQHGTNHGPVVSMVANPASDLLELEDGRLVPLTTKLRNGDVIEIMRGRARREECPRGETAFC